MQKQQEEKKNLSERLDETYGYEPEEEEENKGIAQQLIEAIKAKRDNMVKKGQKVM